MEQRAVIDYPETRYDRDPSIIYREIAGEALLVPIRSTAADLDSIFTLNEVGAFIWKLLDGRKTVRDLRSAVVAEYDTSAEQAAADVAEFLAQLEAIGAVKAA